VIIPQNKAFAYPIEFSGVTAFHTHFSGISTGGLPPLPQAPQLIPQYPYQSPMPYRMTMQPAPYMSLNQGANNYIIILNHFYANDDTAYIDLFETIDMLVAGSEPFSGVEALDIKMKFALIKGSDISTLPQTMAFSLIDYTDPSNPVVELYDEFDAANFSSTSLEHSGSMPQGEWDYIRSYEWLIEGNYTNTLSLDPAKTYILATGLYQVGLDTDESTRKVDQWSIVHPPIINATPARPVSEPSSLILMGIGALAAIFSAKKKT